MTIADDVRSELEKRLDAFMAGGYAFIDAHPEEWRLDVEDNVDLEVTNHVLRVRIQDGTIADHADHVLAMCALQRPDGGWGDRRLDTETQLRSTAFCTQMLLRANRVLDDDTVRATVGRALDYITGHQLADGSWRDGSWHLFDAVSVSVGTLLFAVREPDVTPERQKALDDGMRFILANRAEDARWYYDPDSSPVTISAHLLQKCATFGADRGLVIESAHALLDLQDEAGHWDQENTDHTCDSTRCLMLVASRVEDPALTERVVHAATRAVQWLVDVSVDGAMPNRPGRMPHVERTCDGLDTALKYRSFLDDATRLIGFWR